MLKSSSSFPSCCASPLPPPPPAPKILTLPAVLLICCFLHSPHEILFICVCACVHLYVCVYVTFLSGVLQIPTFAEDVRRTARNALPPISAQNVNREPGELHKLNWTVINCVFTVHYSQIHLLRFAWKLTHWCVCLFFFFVFLKHP